MNSFSHDEYILNLKYLKENFNILDYGEVNDQTENFCIIRHDIEYSLDRAVELAKIENNLGISASYFFQLRNNCYNAISDVNVAKIKKINNLGHKIGLHVYLGDRYTNEKERLKQYVSDDIQILEKVLGFPVDRYSYHRPSKDVLKLQLNIPGKINAYDEKYFTIFGSNKKEKVVYLADSNHRWKYGSIADLRYKNVQRLQVLFHPFSWTKKGYGNYDNFNHLLKEKYDQLKHDIKNEISTFPKEL